MGVWVISVLDITNADGYNRAWNSCKRNIRCEQLALASVQHAEVSPLTCIICVRGPLERYHVASMAVWLDRWLDRVWGEPSYFHVISWTEWVQRRIFAAGLYYGHNESQIRGTGKCVCVCVVFACVCVCCGCVLRIMREGGLKKKRKKTPNTSVLGLSAAITPNHKHGHVQISFKCTMGCLQKCCQTLEIVCRLVMMGALVWATPTLTAWA